MEVPEDCGWGHNPGVQGDVPAPVMMIIYSEEENKCFKFRENLFSSETATQSHCISESISKLMWSSQHLKFPSCLEVQMRSFLHEEKCLFPQFYL